MSNLTVEELTNLTRCPECGVYYAADAGTCPVCELQSAMQLILDNHKEVLDRLSGVVITHFKEDDED